MIETEKTLMEIVTFALAMAAGQLTPGPDMLLILKNTLNHGLSEGLATIAGICLGIVLHVTFVFTGLAAVLTGFPTLFRGLQVVGACYLLWIAVKLLRSLRNKARLEVARDAVLEPSAPRAFREGFVTNLTNVKVMILFSSILAPLAVSAGGLQWEFGAIIIIEAALIWPLFAWLMQRPAIRRAFSRYQRVFNLLFALLIGGFALRILLGL